MFLSQFSLNIYKLSLSNETVYYKVNDFPLDLLAQMMLSLSLWHLWFLTEHIFPKKPYENDIFDIEGIRTIRVAMSSSRIHFKEAIFSIYNK